jgi:hypothetical protein
MYIKRERYLEKIRPFYDADLIKVLTGVRRCGKSVLLEQIEEELRAEGYDDEHIIKVNFEDLQFEKIRNAERLNKYITGRMSDKRKYLIFLDEIQHVRSFEKVLSSLRATTNCSIFITGSNSKLLSTDVMTEFRGRGDRIHIAPLSFSEYYPAHGGTKDEAWNDYLLYGGMPYILNLQDEEEKAKYLLSLHSEIYIKDISERYGITNSSGMEDLQKVLASAVSSLTNPQKISDTFKSSGMKGITAPTIKEYIGYLRDTSRVGEVCQGIERELLDKGQYENAFAVASITGDTSVFEAAYPHATSVMVRRYYDKFFPYMSAEDKMVFLASPLAAEADVVAITSENRAIHSTLGELCGNALSVACGGDGVLVLQKDGTVRFFGEDSYGR